jgi:hypothetical protein
MPLDASGREGQEAEKGGALQEDIVEDEKVCAKGERALFLPFSRSPKVSQSRIDIFFSHVV